MPAHGLHGHVARAPARDGTVGRAEGQGCLAGNPLQETTAKPEKRLPGDAPWGHLSIQSRHGDHAGTPACSTCQGRVCTDDLRLRLHGGPCSSSTLTEAGPRPEGFQ